MSSIVELHPSGHRFQAESGETVLEAALRAGRAPTFGCANGSCGECRARIVEGEVETVRFHDYFLTEAEKRAGYDLLCSVAPRGDLVVESTEASGVDDIAPQTVRARVTRVEPASDDHAVVHLKVQRARVLRYLSGQRATVRFDGVPPCETWLASCPCDAVNLRIHVRRDAGVAFAGFVFDALRRGARATVEGPTGRFVLDDDSPRGLLFLAFDTGFAPVESLIEHAINLELVVPIRLVRVVRRGEGPPYRHNYCRAWADALDDFHYRVVETPGDGESWDALAARVVQAVPDLDSDPGPTNTTGATDATVAMDATDATDAMDATETMDAYVAGPAGFTDACRRRLRESGLPEDRVKVDSLD